MEIENKFTVTRATITYKDGSTESIEYLYTINCRDGYRTFYHMTHDMWELRSHRLMGEAYLSALSRETTELNMDEVLKIEVDWVDDLVAVCEIDDERVMEEVSAWFGLTTKTEYINDTLTDIDVDVWEELEWEAHKRSR